MNILNSIKKLNWPTKRDKWIEEPEDGHMREKQQNVTFHTLQSLPARMKHTPDPFLHFPQPVLRAFN